MFSTVVALEHGRALITVDSAAPTTIQARVPVRGLLSRETLVSIDFRPASGRLFAVSSTNRLYRIDLATGQATNAGNGDAPLASAAAGADFGFDFDANFDIARIVSGSTVNTVYSGVETGSLSATPQIAPAYIATDVNAGVTPDLVAIGHSYLPPLPNPSTLFAIDRATGSLVRLGSEGGVPDVPGTGRLATIGSLGQTITGSVAFDIAQGATAGLLGVEAGPTSPMLLFSTDLATGAITPLGVIGRAKRPVLDFAVAPVGSAILTTDGKVMKIADSNLPHLASFTSPRISGLHKKEKIALLSQRPADGAVFGYTNQQRLYAIVPQSGVATFIGQSTGVGFAKSERLSGDIDPVQNTMRIVTTASKNIRISLADAAPIDADAATAGLQLDSNVVYPAGDPNQGTAPNIRGVAYTQAIANATYTAPFGIDEKLDVLTTISSPDGAQPTTASLFTLGALGQNAVQVVGFDIATASDELTNSAFLVYKGQSGFFLTTVDLQTGSINNPLKMIKGWKPVGMTVLR